MQKHILVNHHQLGDIVADDNNNNYHQKKEVQAA
jgi:hypothetical protein